MDKAIFTSSWDDAHPLDLRIAELLNKYDLKGTFYIPQSSQRPTLAEPDIRMLSDEFEVGGHTLNHVDLLKVDDMTAVREISRSRTWLQDVTGQSCTCFCFPRGRFGNRHIRWVAEAGYLAARTVELLSLEYPSPRMGLYILPTTLQAFDHSAVSYLRNVLKRRRARNLVNYLRWGHSSGWDQIFLDILHYATTHGGVLHLWGHAWEIEENQSWDQLEHTFSLVAQHRQRLEVISNGALLDR